MSKTVTLSNGETFKTIRIAKEYFSGILDEQELKLPFKGRHHVNIQAAYLAYCEVTGWVLPSPPAFFYPVHERGPGYTTRCFGVTFDDGSSDTFSMPKALTAIAT